jgi:gliding motility-associated-like protein
MLFGEGYVAEVEMVSDFIDLGGASSIRRLTWDADLPPGTFVEIRSQTGDTFFIERKYLSKNGIEISEAQWNKLPKSQKQDVIEIQRPGSDWSGWSQVYDFPEEVFLSPSPRRYVQLQVKLGNDDPEVTPVLRNIALHFDEALISGGVTSRIFPRQVAFDSLQTFTYVLQPTFSSGDQGFDRLHIRVPSPVGEVAVRVAGVAVSPVAVAMLGDSLQVDLPELIQGDSVEVEFQSRIQANATLFDAWVSISGQQLLQGVRPEDQHASTVFVPSVATGGSLIRGVDVPTVFTPNGDGVNDVASIRFVLAKVETGAAHVSIHDLSGRVVRLVAQDGTGFAWDGTDDSGVLLPPGAYICRISLVADVGEQAAHRIIGLAY